MAKEKRATWFKLFVHQRAFMEAASDQAVGAAVKAALRYFDTGEETNLKAGSAMIYAALKGSADEATGDFVRKIENGKKGGRPKKPVVSSGNHTQGDQTEAEAEAEADADAEKEAEVYMEKKIKKVVSLQPSDPEKQAAFEPPGTEEVRRYCKEKGYTVDPEAFTDYYTANGWRMGNGPMKDWRAALRSWNRKEKPNAKAQHKPIRTFGIHL